MKSNLFDNSPCYHLGFIDFSLLEKLLKEHDKRYFKGCIKCNPQLLNDSSSLDTNEMWICLDCLVTGCGQNSKSHASSHYKTLSKYSNFHNLSIGSSLNIYCYKCQKNIIEDISKFKDDSQTKFIIQIQKIFFEALKKKDIFRSDLEVEKKETENLLKLKSEVISSNSRTTIYSTKNNENHKIYCFKGLINNTNMCFFNSIIQCLNNNPLIAYKILINNEEPEYFKEEIPFQFKQFMLKIRNKIGNQNNPKELFEKTIGSFNKKFLGYQQQDAHEAFIILMDGLIEEHKKFLEKIQVENKDIDQTFFGKLFSSKLINNIFCLTCRKNYLKTDDFIDLSLAIDNITKKPVENLNKIYSNKRFTKEIINGEVYFLPNKISKVQSSSENSVTTIEEALSLFFEKEQLEGKEFYKCEECKESPLSIREFYLSKCPLILVLHLKRFSGSSYLISKCSKKVDFSETLSLEDYICFKESNMAMLDQDLIKYINESTISDAHNEKFEYALYGVVSHSGNMHKGHYFSYVKDLKEKKWYYISDTFVHDVNISTVFKSEAYMLFYIKKSEI